MTNQITSFAKSRINTYLLLSVSLSDNIYTFLIYDFENQRGVYWREERDNLCSGGSKKLTYKQTIFIRLHDYCISL